MKRDAFMVGVAAVTAAATKGHAGSGAVDELVASRGIADVNYPTGTDGLLVVAKRGDEVQFFDPESLQVRSRIPLPKNPHEVALSPDHARAYVLIYGDGVYGNNEHPDHRIAVIDLKALSLQGFIDLGKYRAPHGMMFDRDSHLWVTCDADATLVAINLEKRRVVDAVPTKSTGTHFMTMLPDYSRIYTSNKQDHFMSVIDVGERRLISTIPLPNGADGLCTSRDGARVYILDFVQPLLHVVDTKTNEIMESVVLQGQTEHAMRVRVTPDDQYALTSSYAGDVVTALRAEDLKEQRIVSVRKVRWGSHFVQTGVAFWSPSTMRGQSRRSTSTLCR